LVLGANLAEVDAAIFYCQAAAAAIVTRLDDLALQRFVGEVVADAGDEIESLAGLAAVAGESANLIRKRLLKEGKLRRGLGRKVTERRIVIEAEVSQGDEELAVGLHFHERADGDQP
jgi:hypothetical protein